MTEPKARAGSKRIALRREAVARAMVTRSTTRDAVRKIADEYGCSISTVYIDMRAVLREQAEFAKTLDRSEVHAWLVDNASDLYSKAMTRRRIVRDAKGQPVIDENGERVREDDPNLNAAVRALYLIAQLQGLASNKVEVAQRTLTKNAGVAPEGGLTREDVEFLRNDILGLND